MNSEKYFKDREDELAKKNKGKKKMVIAFVVPFFTAVIFPIPIEASKRGGGTKREC